jgi:hypothetical protein
VARNPQSVAVLHPHWRGIRSAATQLFDELYPLDDTLDEASGLHAARIFAEAGCPALVIQGFPLTYTHLVQGLRRIAPRLPVYVVWHGTFLQAREDYTWESFRAVERLCRAGAIARWGFVKPGMAEIMANQGLRTGYVMNMVRALPQAASEPLEGGPHLGMWSIHPTWHKLPYEMMAATSLVPNSVIHASGIDERTRQFAELLGLRAQLQQEAIPQQQMPQVLAQMHLNMYVTFNECAPMLPLESLAVGAPCLLGPNSPYFEDHDYLLSRLVVPQPDSAHMIARYAQAALEEREAIIAAYREYAPGYNARARTALGAFLGL